MFFITDQDLDSIKDKPKKISPLDQDLDIDKYRRIF